MNTTRDLKIAREAGLNPKVLSVGTFIDYINDHGHRIIERLDLSKPNQLQMIEDWVIDQGYEINMKRLGIKNKFIITHPEDNDFHATNQREIVNKSIAFLQAVEQLIDAKNKTR